MIDTDFTISLSKWGLNLEAHRASLASENIASANIGGKRKIGDFESMIQSMSSAIDQNDKVTVDSILNNSATVMESKSNSSFNKISLDEEIMTLSSSTGRYKIIAEALSRKFGLMSIASKGR
jgi:flagellar basal body rod protein FlgB